MQLIQQKLNKLTNKATIIKRAAMAGLTAAVLSLGSVSLAFADDSELVTVYHVYLKDQYIGTASNKEVVKEVIGEKKDEAKGEYEKLELTTGSQLSFVPEQVFRSTADDQQVANSLESQLQLQAEAAAISIDGSPVVYLENKAAADEVLKKLTLKYVPEDQLNEWNTRKQTLNSTLPPLKENETRLLDVHFSKETSVNETAIEPGKVLSIDQAVTLLEKGTLENQKYIVKEGDVLSSIASEHHLKMEQIVALNPGLNENSVLELNKEINVTVPVPYVDVMVETEVFKKEAIPFSKKVILDDSKFKGKKSVKQQGKDGSRTVTYTLSSKNGSLITKNANNEEILQQPVEHIVVKGTKEIPSRGDGSLAWPADGGYVSSKMGYRWGKMHKGIDIARPDSFTIKAADNGVVESAGWDDSGYGNKIVIDHQNGYKTTYAHLKSIDVNAGQTVVKGSKIGVMGSTGDSTGTHLHFELHKNGNLKNALSYLKK